METIWKISQELNIFPQQEFYLDLITDENQEYFNLRQEYLTWIQNHEVIQFIRKMRPSILF